MEKTLRVWLRPSDLLLFLLLLYLYLSLSSVCLDALVSGRLQAGERLRERQGQEKDPGGLHYPSMEKTVRVWLRPSALSLASLSFSFASVPRFSGERTTSSRRQIKRKTGAGERSRRVYSATAPSRSTGTHTIAVSRTLLGRNPASCIPRCTSGARMKHPHTNPD